MMEAVTDRLEGVRAVDLRMTSLLEPLPLTVRERGASGGRRKG